ncbi:uncharacterized protein LOC134530471 [Bacillus rossius redtenbacheri]|uniref:uncharacterized protein LOC134530471 n=1 Tax=Bacillus rossius redtenbacheri TaxID=93214 RepID=UPI002FDE0F01
MSQMESYLTKLYHVLDPYCDQGTGDDPLSLQARIVDGRRLLNEMKVALRTLEDRGRVLERRVANLRAENSSLHEKLRASARGDQEDKRRRRRPSKSLRDVALLAAADGDRRRARASTPELLPPLNLAEVTTQTDARDCWSDATRADPARRLVRTGLKELELRLKELAAAAVRRPAAPEQSREDVLRLKEVLEGKDRAAELVAALTELQAELATLMEHSDADPVPEITPTSGQ